MNEYYNIWLLDEYGHFLGSYLIEEEIDKRKFNKIGLIRINKIIEMGNKIKLEPFMLIYLKDDINILTYLKKEENKKIIWKISCESLEELLNIFMSIKEKYSVKEHGENIRLSLKK